MKFEVLHLENEYLNKNYLNCFEEAEKILNEDSSNTSALLFCALCKLHFGSNSFPVHLSDFEAALSYFKLFCSKSDAKIYISEKVKCEFLEQIYSIYNKAEKLLYWIEPNFMSTGTNSESLIIPVIGYGVTKYLEPSESEKQQNIDGYLYVLDRLIYILEAYNNSVMKDEEVLQTLLKILKNNTDQRLLFKNHSLKFLEDDVVNEFNVKYDLYSQELEELIEKKFWEPIKKRKRFKYEELVELHEKNYAKYIEITEYYKKNQKVYYYSTFLKMHHKITGEFKKAKRIQMILSILIIIIGIAVISYFIYLRRG